MVHALGDKIFLDETRLMKMVVLSGFIHFLAFFLFVFLPNFSSNPAIRVVPQYTPVLLVGQGDLAGGTKSLVKPITVAKANVTAKKPDLIQKKVEAKPIEISKTEPKKPETVTPPAKKEETQNSQGEEQKVSQAIENIRERVGKEGQAASSAMVGGIGVGTNIEGGGSGAPEMYVYMSIVVDRIMEAWFLPPGLKEEAINQSLLTIIDIRIDRDGKVTLQGIEQRSGNSGYDNYALQAIQKIQVHSFPPLPEVYREQFLDLGIKFNPSEVNA